VMTWEAEDIIDRQVAPSQFSTALDTIKTTWGNLLDPIRCRSRNRSRSRKRSRNER
jgi:hypothetical protein